MSRVPNLKEFIPSEFVYLHLSTFHHAKVSIVQVGIDNKTQKFYSDCSGICRGEIVLPRIKMKRFHEKVVKNFIKLVRPHKYDFFTARVRILNPKTKLRKLSLLF